MAVGWYLKADGETHELHDSGGWSGLTLPLELGEPATWDGHFLGSVDAEALSHAIRCALKVVHFDDSGDQAAAGIELHFADGAIRASSQQLGGELFASFSVPVSDADAHQFTCLISAADAQSLIEFGYPRMELRLGSTAQWCPTLIPSSESGIALQPIVCSREGARGIHGRRAGEQFVAGAVLDPLALQATLGSMSSRHVEVRWRPHGIQLAAFDKESGVAGASKDVQTVGVAGEQAHGVFDRRNLLAAVAELERTVEQLELSLAGTDSARYLSVAPYGSQSVSGWFQQKEGVRL